MSSGVSVATMKQQRHACRLFEEQTNPAGGTTMERIDDKTAFTKRAGVYEQFFGEVQHVWHENTPEDPHIDIYCFKPEIGGRDFFTLVTSGMSDRRMDVPPDAPADIFTRRAEMIFYCSDPRTEYAELLRRMAHYPFDRNTWLGAGHTMETSEVALLQSGGMDSLLFIPPPLIPDQLLSESLQVGGDPVGLLWVVPVAAGECRLIRAEGIGPLLRLFDMHHHPFVFATGRSSYV